MIFVDVEHESANLMLVIDLNFLAKHHRDLFHHYLSKSGSHLSQSHGGLCQIMFDAYQIWDDDGESDINLCV